MFQGRGIPKNTSPTPKTVWANHWPVCMVISGWARGSPWRKPSLHHTHTTYLCMLKWFTLRNSIRHTLRSNARSVATRAGGGASRASEERHYTGEFDLICVYFPKANFFLWTPLPYKCTCADARTNLWNSICLCTYIYTSKLHRLHTSHKKKCTDRLVQT